MKTKFFIFDTACHVTGMNSTLLRSLSLIVAAVFFLNAQAAEPTSFLTTALTTSLGANLDAKEAQTSIGIEPQLTFRLAEKTNLELYALIDRPTDAYKNFSVPMITLTPSQQFDLIPGFKSSASFLISALQLDEWKAEGSMVKVRPALRLAKELLKGLSLSGRVGPYIQFNRYAQSTAGKDRTRYGINEKLGLDYELGGFSVQLAVVFDQRHTAVWKNDYSTFEQVAYNFNDGFGIGVNHSLLGGFVDESTGYYKKMQLFDSRQSRVSAFIEVKF